MAGGYFYHGEYIVEHKEKYLGSKNPKFRSSWEKRFCFWCDNNDNITKWGYEILDITYFSPIDNKVHRYFPDFYFEAIAPNGKIKKYLVEVKPKKSTEPPKKPKNKNRKAVQRFMEDTENFIINQSKWKSAKKFCTKRGLEFKIITEKDLF